MKVLVTGSAGQVGREVVAALEAEHAVVATDRSTVDVSDAASLREVITQAQPEVIVHAAAMTDVDGCELDPGAATAINDEGTRNVADAAKAVGARIVFLSTDYVFDGELDRPYREDDAPNPLSVYGKTKRAAESYIDTSSSAIVRTSWVWGRHGKNMVKTVLGLAQKPGELRFVNDQIGYPTYATDLATMIKTIIEAQLTGIFHVTNQGEASWYDFAREVMIAAGQDPERVQPISTAELDPPRPAPRPANSRLENARLKAHGIALLPDYRESLEPVVKELS